MQPLANKRHEAFAQNLAKGMSAAHAYEQAGYAYNEGNAVRLKRNEKVAARVEELQAELNERLTEAVVIDKQWVTSKLAYIVKKHIDTVPQAANRALELLGREHGMFVERHADVSEQFAVTDEPLSEDEWEAAHSVQH